MHEHTITAINRKTGKMRAVKLLLSRYKLVQAKRLVCVSIRRSRPQFREVTCPVIRASPRHEGSSRSYRRIPRRVPR